MILNMKMGIYSVNN